MRKTVMLCLSDKMRLPNGWKVTNRPSPLSDSSRADWNGLPEQVLTISNRLTNGRLTIVAGWNEATGWEVFTDDDEAAEMLLDRIEDLAKGLHERFDARVARERQLVADTIRRYFGLEPTQADQDPDRHHQLYETFRIPPEAMPSN